MAVFPVFYGGSIGYYQTLLKATNPLFEVHEHYVKQSPRTRLEILSPNGRQRLVIPTRKTGNRKPMHAVEISYEENWQKEHWKGLEAAYRRSPYFEYYEDRFVELYKHKTKSLVEFNLEIHNAILNCLRLDLPSELTEAYEDIDGGDLRKSKFPLINAELYIQVFEDRHPFTANLSVLDALFNLGPSTLGLIGQ
ncbi:MAG: WbqC family protein [Flavobacteriales bacterium]|nr:WbqC family protein [Flavobacteriales bacterium]